MERKYNLFQIDAFTKEPFKGNPAAVTFGEDLTDKEMQLIAREMNLPETAFILSSDKADYKLRWFTTVREVDLCGHATIASLHYLNELDKIRNRDRITFETKSGILNCPVGLNDYTVFLPLPKLNKFNNCNDDIIRSFNIDNTSIDYKYPFIILNNGYLYIYVKNLSSLKTLNPDFNRLRELSSKCGFSDVNLFTLETFDEASFAHSRFYSPFDGIIEDPVTGSANGPLMLVLLELGLLKSSGERITKIFEQGDIIGRPGRVTVSYSPQDETLSITGNAVTVFKGELYI